MKMCSTCKVEKPFEEFSKDKTKKDSYHNQCKSCKKKYREENKDKISEKSKQYIEENKDKISEYKKQYREENKDKICEYAKQYYEENKDKVNAKSAKRRAKKLQATPSWLTDEQKQEIIEFYKLRKILTKETGILHHVDHIIPLKGDRVCGLHVPWNLQVISASENLSKSNKLLEELLFELDSDNDIGV